MRVEKGGDLEGRGLRDLINVIEISSYLFVSVPGVFAEHHVFIVLAPALSAASLEA